MGEIKLPRKFDSMKFNFPDDPSKMKSLESMARLKAGLKEDIRKSKQWRYFCKYPRWYRKDLKALEKEFERIKDENNYKD